MRAHVAFEIRVDFELGGAYVALEGRVSGVRPQMDDELARVARGVGTDHALEGPIVRMRPHVLLHRAALRTSVIAELVERRKDILVISLDHSFRARTAAQTRTEAQTHTEAETRTHAVSHLTSERLEAGVDALVNFELVDPIEGLLALAADEGLLYEEEREKMRKRAKR